MDVYNELYPQLPDMQTGENFRLKQRSEWLAYLERELSTRMNIYKKYKRTRSLFLKIATASGTLSVALSVGGLGTGMTGVGLPVVVSLGALGGFCVVARVISGGWAKMIFKNVRKHEITVSFCRAKLNTIKDIGSKALIDNKISHEEFLLVKTEIEKYHQMRNSIRQKYRKQPSQPEQIQQPDIEQIKKKIREDLMKKRGRKALVNWNCFTFVVGGYPPQDFSTQPPAYNADY